MSELTFKYDTLKPTDVQPNVNLVDVPAWIDGLDEIRKVGFDPDLCVAGILEDENWRGYPQHALVVYWAAKVSDEIAVSEQSVYEVKEE